MAPKILMHDRTLAGVAGAHESVSLCTNPRVILSLPGIQVKVFLNLISSVLLGLDFINLFLGEVMEQLLGIDSCTHQNQLGVTLLKQMLQNHK